MAETVIIHLLGGETLTAFGSLSAISRQIEGGQGEERPLPWVSLRLTPDGSRTARVQTAHITYLQGAPEGQ